MKKAFQVLLAVVLIAGLLYTITKDSKSQSENELANLAQAAFISLDTKVTSSFSKGFQLNEEAAASKDPIAPLFENMGNHSFPISSANETAQAYFNQGLSLSYAFNHAEAHRSFAEAARQDENAAMAYWGQAYALGPNINDPLPDEQRKAAAFEAIKQAFERKAYASEKEMDLMHALSQRYGFSEDPGKKISHGYLAGEKTDLDMLNKAYSESMKKLADKYAQDADILTMYAASVMDLMPWNYWDKAGNANAGINEAKLALEEAMKINPNHPGAHHYYIHLVELPKPELAVPSAEVLAGLMPAAGHIVHMPSHIFIRVGRYQEAAMTNIEAIKADEDYISQCYSQGLYPLGYYPHNIHFLWSSASLMGNSATALAAARKTAEKIPVGLMESFTFAQDFYSTPMLAYVRFGKWNDILTIPNPGPAKHVSMIWHYARGIAFIRKGNIEEAEEELSALKEVTNDPSLESLVANLTNPSSSIAKVAYHVLAGELEAAKGYYEEAEELLRKGIIAEDALVYSEPAPWHIPVRQTLGALLLKTDKPEEAEIIYRQDLKKVPKNGWSLKGLQQSLIAQGKEREARDVRGLFEEAWKHADIEIYASVF